MSDTLLARAREALSSLACAEENGLPERVYHIPVLTRLEQDLSSRNAYSDSLQERLGAFDLLLTDAFLTLRSHLSAGMFSSESLSVVGGNPASDSAGASALESAIAGGSCAAALRSYEPDRGAYAGLKGALKRMRRTVHEGGWRPVILCTELRPGDSGAGVVALRRRLESSGDLRPLRRGSPGNFDDILAGGVRTFQSRHGLQETGILDTLTRAALNVTAAERFGQILANLERLRWESRAHTPRLVRVNCATQVLTLVSRGIPLDTMKVVVGLPGWQTKIFFSAIDRIVLNPHWVSPRRILAEELVSYIRADSNYLRSNRMKLQRDSAGILRDVDPRSIDWQSLTAAQIDFRLLQEPGPGNIMGKMKFLAPNNYDIYLHDTPYRDDFPKRTRLASHGCVRLEDPATLLKFLLGRDIPPPGFAESASPDSLTERVLRVTPPVPLAVVYQTCWTDRGGALHFREDVYGLDLPLARALREMH